MTSPPRSLYVCACGRPHENRKELRVHIALETDRWPIDRCSPEHHDPADVDDARNLTWQAMWAHPFEPAR
jgi:hypothetical protein